MAYRSVEEESLTAVADAIRAKTGESEVLTFPDGFSAAIAGIKGSVDLSGVTAEDSDVVAGKVFMGSDGTEKTGTLVVQTYYTGTEAPSDDLGVDGDLYLQL